MHEDDHDESDEESLYSDDSKFGNWKLKESRNFDEKWAKGHWTAEEDSLLHEAVQKYEAKNWKKIAEDLNGRTDV